MSNFYIEFTEPKTNEVVFKANTLCEGVADIIKHSSLAYKLVGGFISRNDYQRQLYDW